MPKNFHLSLNRDLLVRLFEIYLLVLILVGVTYRFNWVNWSQGTNLHPDEYGLTNTLTQLNLPKSLGEYINTRLSPLSPYSKYDQAGNHTVDGPDNGMRWGQWPMIIIRACAELTGNTGYNEMRLMGRVISAIADTLSILLVFLIGERLYNRTAGLLAAALSALAVLQIQQSHFMTVDNFAVVFTMLAMYAAVRVAQSPPARRLLGVRAGDPLSGAPGVPGSDQGNPGSGEPDLPAPKAPVNLPRYQADRQSLLWYLLFGVAFGMAMASKINLLPLAGMILVAAFLGIADLKLKTQADLPRILGIAVLYLVVAGAASVVTFRVTQPMSFRAVEGNTTLLTTHINPDWGQNMQAASRESKGIGGGPPSEQWSHRPVIIFPLVNMVLWGMGLPLGLMGWTGLLWVTWRLFRHGENWRSHLLPLIWTGGYFLFMATRWVKSIRYFLPIYPFVALFAAWGLVELWKGIRWDARKSRTGRVILLAILTAVVTLGTLAWATAFVNAIYRTDHTRIQAVRWTYQNIPSPFQLTLSASDGQDFRQPVTAPDGLVVSTTMPFVQGFDASFSGSLSEVVIPHAKASSDGSRLRIAIAVDPDGQVVVDETEIVVNSTGPADLAVEVRGTFHNASLHSGTTYYLISSSSDHRITINRTRLSTESWDEGLPFPFAGWDPYGQSFRGVTMEVRWYDDEKKKEMFLSTIDAVDYIIVPSQRGVWSSCRLPVTFPMTMEYYRALFDGRLGFELAAMFTAPLKLGPLEISDVGGTWAWGKTPSLPVFNHSQLAAEEAFSVYDHPPVWIFKKRPDYSLKNVATILDSVDLSKVKVQAPREATGVQCP